MRRPSLILYLLILLLVTSCGHLQQDRTIETADATVLDSASVKSENKAKGEELLALGFSTIEVEIILEARRIIMSQQFANLLDAQKLGESATEIINGRLIQYEPGLPASGMTMFGENGFLIGREAFDSTEELDRTILHELYRLRNSSSSGGVSGSLATQETEDAFNFAMRAEEVLR